MVAGGWGVPDRADTQPLSLPSGLTAGNLLSARALPPLSPPRRPNSTASGSFSGGSGEVAERRGDHALAMEHLDAAGALFAKRGAKLYLDQVIAKKQILKA